MGLFGKSFEEKVEEAIETILGMSLGVRRLEASCEDEVVTLTGEATSKEAKFRVMREFNDLVETKNTVNAIRVVEPTPAAVPAETAPEAAEETPAGERIHEVVSGDTLYQIAKSYLGNGNLYPKIFEANRDILDNPNMIKVGQKLRIPDLSADTE